MKSNRPLSPHLQVYDLPLTAKMSISHRLTGIILSVGTFLLLLLVISAAFGKECYQWAHGVLAGGPGKTLLFLWSFCLFFHLCNGIRHIFWDIGYGFSLPAAHRASIAVCIVATLLTVVIWSIAYVIN